MSAERDIIERLQRYLDGDLEPDEARHLEDQVAADPRLAQLLSLIRAMRQAPKPGGDLKTAAGNFINRFVKDLGLSKVAGRHGLLTFDSGLLPLPAGIRPATLDSRRLRYTADNIQLEISVYPASAGTFEVIGQVEGYQSGVELEVSLRRGRQILRERTNPFQVFHFVRVVEGSYNLAVTDPDGTRFEFSLEL